jgi:replicative DNA helicase
VGKANTKKSQVVSNLFLSGREARLRAPSGMDSSGQNQWAALRAAHEMVSEKPKSMVLVYLYNSARTHFIRNSGS